MKHLKLFDTLADAIGFEQITPGVCVLKGNPKVLYIPSSEGESVNIILDMDDTSFINYEKYICPYFCLTALLDGSTITLDIINVREFLNDSDIYFDIRDNLWNFNFEISTDGRTFRNNRNITLNRGECIYILGISNTLWPYENEIVSGDDEEGTMVKKDNEYPHISLTGRFKASGDIRSLVDEDCPSGYVINDNYNYLFYNYTDLVDLTDIIAL